MKIFWVKFLNTKKKKRFFFFKEILIFFSFNSKFLLYKILFIFIEKNF
jgi:hypothetical protein